MSSPYPLPYATPVTLSPRPRRWPLWTGLTVLALFVILLVIASSAGPASTSIAMSDFRAEILDGNVKAVEVTSAELRGVLARPVTINGQTVGPFRTDLPSGVGEQWFFNQWLLDNANGAVISAAHQSVWVNLLIPVIPWILIFGFIWLFIFRGLRTRQAAQPLPVVVVNPPVPAPPPPQT